ncbi:MAG: hypothetical protein QOF25_2353 [Mycobacterium sp.]|nr:hypothetical protein [Mycobacterium sp.]
MPSVRVMSGASAFTRMRWGGQFEGRSLGVVDHPGLGRSVCRVARCRSDAFDRRDADDAAGQSRLDEAACHPLRAQQNVPQVRLAQGIPTVFTGVEDRGVKDAACVVHQDRHRSQRGDGLRQRRVDLGAVADVGGDAERADLVSGGSARRRIAFPHGNPGTEGDQARGDAATDACAATGHHGHAVGQKHVGGSYRHDENIGARLQILQVT